LLSGEQHSARAAQKGTDSRNFARWQRFWVCFAAGAVGLPSASAFASCHSAEHVEQNSTAAVCKVSALAAATVAAMLAGLYSHVVEACTMEEAKVLYLQLGLLANAGLVGSTTFCIVLLPLL
jgi:hypothetical protein